MVFTKYLRICNNEMIFPFDFKPANENSNIPIFTIH